MNDPRLYIRPSIFDRIEMFVFKVIHGSPITYEDNRTGIPDFGHRRGLIDYLKIVCPNEKYLFGLWVPVFCVILGGWLV